MAGGVLDWQQDALCAQVDPELFFPQHSGNSEARAAQRICAKCPVRWECTEYALATDERYGIWGGLTEPMRSRLAKDTA